MLSAYDSASASDIEIISEQIRRPARGVLAVAYRMEDTQPAVVVTKPRLPDGTPFPTVYYLTHPELVAAMSRLEAAGVMKKYNELLENDEELKAHYTRAHEKYIADRSAIENIPELEHISAGGMPVRVKCLHALAAHALAAGKGVNPIGDMALFDANIRKY